MLRICICDDKAEDVAQIRTLVDCFAEEHPELTLLTQSFSSPFDLLEHLEKWGGFDLYLWTF